jgi:hypothetical protein
MSTTANANRPIDVARSFFTGYDKHDVNKMFAECNESAELRYVPMGSQDRGKVHELARRFGRTTSMRFRICTLRPSRCSVTSATSRPK